MTVDVPIHLTQTLLDTGIRDDCGKCPIALAFEAACPGAKDVNVGRLFLDFFAGDIDHTIRLPWESRNFIDAYDNDYKPAPRTLVIPIPRDVASIPGFLLDESLLSPPALEPIPL